MPGTRCGAVHRGTLCAGGVRAREAVGLWLLLHHPGKEVQPGVTQTPGTDGPHAQWCSWQGHCCPCVSSLCDVHTMRTSPRKLFPGCLPVNKQHLHLLPNFVICFSTWAGAIMMHLIECPLPARHRSSLIVPGLGAPPKGTCGSLLELHWHWGGRLARASVQS